MENSLQRLIQLRTEGHLDEALQLALKLHGDAPRDPIINYHCAWTCDVMGREREAAPFYERALAEGLSGEERRGALLGLGSTLRNIGELARSAEILRQGIHEYPDGREFQVFLAITLHDLGEHRDAIFLLLRNLAETTEDAALRSYRRALSFYAESLGG